MANFNNFDENDELRAILGIDTKIMFDNNLQDNSNISKERKNEDFFKSFDLLSLNVNSNFLKLKESSEEAKNNTYTPLYKEKTYSKNNSIMSNVKSSLNLNFKISNDNIHSKSLLNNVFSSFPVKEINRNKIKITLFVENIIRKFNADKNAKIDDNKVKKDNSKNTIIYKFKTNKEKYFTKVSEIKKEEEEEQYSEEEPIINNSKNFAEKTRIREKESNNLEKKKIMENKKVGKGNNYSKNVKNIKENSNNYNQNKQNNYNNNQTNYEYPHNNENLNYAQYNNYNDGYFQQNYPQNKMADSNYYNNYYYGNNQNNQIYQDKNPNTGAGGTKKIKGRMKK